MTDSAAREMLAILHSNCGFENPEDWVSFGIQHGFQRVSAVDIKVCPDCDRTCDRVLGQYVYYSTLIRLRECSCSLIWADVAIEQSVLTGHFEQAYKDEQYFIAKRRRVFDQVAGLVSLSTPRGGSVIDIGGGMGHLMSVVRNSRPDLNVAVLDVSGQSVEYCNRHFAIPATQGLLADLRSEKFDTAVLSDVLYYEGDIRNAWEVLSQVADTLVIRVPNKLAWIRATRRHSRLQTQVRYFNPEHRYILSRNYLTTRLAGLGFASVEVLPTPPLAPSSWPMRTLANISYGLAKGLHSVTGIVASPSMVVVARRISASQ